MSDATEAEARALLEAANKAVDDIRPLHDLIEEMERVRSEHFDDEDTEEEGAAAAARMEASMRGVIDASAHSDRAKSVDIPAIIVEWNRRVRHESSLSRLVDGVLSSAAPLLESTDPRVRLAAAEVCSASLGAIAACDACSAPETAVYDTVKRLHPHDVPQTHGDNERPVRLLPRVHQLWPHLMMSLGHRLGPDILPEPFKASLELLRRCAEVSGGDFIARRMSTDAWPQLARVLKVGVKHADSESLVKRMETLYLGADGDTFFDDVRPDVDEDGLGGGKRGRETAGSAPQKTETVRRAIMKTLADIGARERSRMALRDVAAAAVSVVAPFAVTSGSDGKSSPGDRGAVAGADIPGAGCGEEPGNRRPRRGVDGAGRERDWPLGGSDPGGTAVDGASRGGAADASKLPGYHAGASCGMCDHAGGGRSVSGPAGGVWDGYQEVARLTENCP